MAVRLGWRQCRIRRRRLNHKRTMANRSIEWVMALLLRRAPICPTRRIPDRARKKKLRGTVILAIIVTPEGNVGDVKVVRGFDPEMDQNALNTVRTWKFEPTTKDGKPVAVAINVEASFKLY